MAACWLAGVINLLADDAVWHVFGSGPLAGDYKGKRRSWRHLYRRTDRVIGFSLLGRNGAGPMAVLEPADLPAILLRVEGLARTMGLERAELQVPAPNAIAIRHLMGRRYRFDPWINILMSDRPFGQFDRFIPFSPPLFL